VNLIDKLRQRPFQPFRLHVTDGSAFDIRHPEMLMVMRQSAVVGMLETGQNGNSDDRYPRIDRSTNIALFHLTRLEEPPQSQQRTSE